jgi:hypothetical protein
MVFQDVNNYLLSEPQLLALDAYYSKEDTENTVREDVNNLSSVVLSHVPHFNANAQ